MKITTILLAPHSGLNSDWKQMKLDKPDVFSCVHEDYESKVQTQATRRNLDGDAYLIVVVGRYIHE